MSSAFGLLSPIFMPSLLFDLEFHIENLCDQHHVHPVEQQELNMLDALFLVLGLGGFALMAVYAWLCDRL